MKSKLFTKILHFFGEGTLFKQYQKEVDSVKEVQNNKEYERCVICGALTCVPISMPIDWRKNYEIGIGQICSKCAKKTQVEANRAKVLSYEQILTAVEQCRKENEK